MTCTAVSLCQTSFPNKACLVDTTTTSNKPFFSRRDCDTQLKARISMSYNKIYQSYGFYYLTKLLRFDCTSLVIDLSACVVCVHSMTVLERCLRVGNDVTCRPPSHPESPCCYLMFRLLTSMLCRKPIIL